MLGETRPETAHAGGEFSLQIVLEDGDEIWTSAGVDGASARAELATLHTRLDASAFVLVGDAIVRSAEVRYIRLHHGGGQHGVIDALKSRGGGDDEMGTYDDEERTTLMQGASRRPGATRGGDGSNFADQYVGYGWRPWAETKPFFMTSEFFAAALMIAGVLIAAAVDDALDAPRAWALATAIAAAYILSRGIAKSGTKDPNPTRERR